MELNIEVRYTTAEILNENAKDLGFSKYQIGSAFILYSFCNSFEGIEDQTVSFIASRSSVKEDIGLSEDNFLNIMTYNDLDQFMNRDESIIYCIDMCNFVMYISCDTDGAGYYVLFDAKNEKIVFGNSFTNISSSYKEISSVFNIAILPTYNDDFINIADSEKDEIMIAYENGYMQALTEVLPELMTNYLSE